MMSDAVDRRRDLHDVLLQTTQLYQVSALSCIIHAHIELREHVGTTIDATIATHQDTFARDLLGSAKHGEILTARLTDSVCHALEIDGIGRRVLSS